VGNIESFDGLYITITYDSSQLQLINIAGHTNTNHITTGMIPGTDITVTKAEPGLIIMTISKVIPSGMSWSGVITLLRFEALITGTAMISVTR
jgi:hypothetical protein